ncbi:MAG: amidohydrolase family protein [Pseudomonadota bacterium]
MESPIRQNEPSLLDSHVHFVDPSRPEGLVWPASDSPLHRSLLPPDLAAAYGERSPSGCIAVETSRRETDDQWLLQLAAREPLVRGVVLNLQADLHDFEVRLENALRHDKFVGIRLRPIADYDLSSGLLKDNLRRLGDAGKTVEFGAQSGAQKAEFERLANSLPDVLFILDHAGHPPSPDAAFRAWQTGIRKIGMQPNTVSKVTGIAAGSERVFATLMETFGEHRLLYGSNWPVCALSVQEMTANLECLTRFAGDAAAALFSANAERAYKLDEAAKAAAAGTSGVSP